MRRVMGRGIRAWTLALALVPVPARAQAALSEAPASARLTIDDAIAGALAHSRSIAIADLAEARADEDLAVARTRHLPSFSAETQVSRLLRPVEITFPAGAFGTFADTGPVPASDTAITTPARISLLLNSSVSQPLTGLVRARLGVRANEAALASAHEDARQARLAVVRDVKRTYYAVLQATRALDAADATGRMLAELDAVVTDRIAQRVALKGDGLDVQVRRAELDQTTLELRQTIAAGTERLNHLLGRPLDAPLTVEPVPEMTPRPAVDAGAAIEARPDVRLARLRVRQADLAVRDAAVDLWPSADLTVQSITPMNIDGAPRNITSVALRVSWTPFDWGRRARVKAARALEARRAVDAAADAASAAALEINGCRRAVEAAQVALRTATAARAAAEEQARVKTSQYRLRAVLLADVLEAHATLADRSARADQALLALFSARANLDFALGEDVLP